MTSGNNAGLNGSFIDGRTVIIPMDHGVTLDQLQGLNTQETVDGLAGWCGRDSYPQ
jgi:DhnA family fructose-bisphosphate aldolase class Ia